MYAVWACRAPNRPFRRSPARAGVELFGLVVVYLCSAFVIGLQSVGEQLADPFGSDVVDLAVEHFLQVD